MVGKIMSLELKLDPGPCDGKVLRSSKGSLSLDKVPAVGTRLKKEDCEY